MVKLKQRSLYNNFRGGPAQPVEFNLWMWTHPPVSGLVLASGLVCLISLVKFSLISVIANIALGLLLLGVGCRLYVHLMGFLKKPCNDPLDNVRDIDVTLPAEKVDAWISSGAEFVNTTAVTLRNLVLVENYVESIKFGVLMYLLTFVGAIFNPLTLVILGWIGAFLFPTIYDQNQDKFDDLAAQLVEKYQGVNQKLTAMLPAPKKVATNGTNGAVAAGQEKEE